MEFQPMSPEEVERTVTFLLHQQAQVEASLASASRKIDQMGEGILGLTNLVDRVDRRAEEVFGRVDALVASMGAVRDGLIGLTGIVGRMGERVDQRLDAVTEVQQRQTKVGERIDQRLDRLVETGTRTDQRLDQLAKAQERQMKGGERIDRRLDRLAKAQERTDRQINKLGDHFKRHLRKNHGQGSS